VLAAKGIIRLSITARHAMRPFIEILFVAQSYDEEILHIGTYDI